MPRPLFAPARPIALTPGRCSAAALVVLAATLVVGTTDAGSARGRRTRATAGGGVQAAFTERSYPPGARAVLQLRGRASLVRIRLYHAGAGDEGPLQGSPVDSVR